MINLILQATPYYLAALIILGIVMLYDARRTTTASAFRKGVQHAEDILGTPVSEVTGAYNRGLHDGREEALASVKQN